MREKKRSQKDTSIQMGSERYKDREREKQTGDRQSQRSGKRRRERGGDRRNE